MNIEMKEFVVTFGTSESHKHVINGKKFGNWNGITRYASIKAPSYESGRKLAFDCFGGSFSFFVTMEEFDKNYLRFEESGEIELVPLLEVKNL